MNRNHHEKLKCHTWPDLAVGTALEQWIESLQVFEWWKNFEEHAIFLTLNWYQNTAIRLTWSWQDIHWFNN